MNVFLIIQNLLICINVVGETSFLQNLRLKMCRTQLQAFNEGTLSNYIRHCVVYLDFCKLIGANCFPLEPKKSALFVSYLNNGDRNADTIRNYHSSVRTVARLFGYTVPKQEFPDVLLVLKGIKNPVEKPAKLHIQLHQ